jgi:hypothetical protein
MILYQKYLKKFRIETSRYQFVAKWLKKIAKKVNK